MINGISRRTFAQFCRREQAAFAVLFGSAARGRRTAHSDLDLAFWLASRRLDGRTPALTHQLMRLLGCNDVDVVVLNRASALLQWQVASTGRLLYERRPGAFQQFQLRAFRRHQDAHRLYRWTAAYLDRMVARHD